ncbi:aldose 1-epimerase [Pseudonocardia sichuanensis]
MSGDGHRLSSPELEVLVDPARGADIVSVVPTRIGRNVLFSSPWSGSPATAAPPPATGNSHVDWHTRYRGGWQVLCPNAGDERQAHGTVWGFHGEAALVPWRVTAAGPSAIACETELTTAPLRLQREITVTGPVLRVAERLTNLAPVALEVHWVQHPAFGHPLIDRGARLAAGATRLLADPTIPGTLLEADAAYDWPVEPVATLPGCDEPRAVFACLTGFRDRAWYTITNPDLDLTVRVTWPARTWPHAWLWQELHAGTGFPWFGRGHACAVEPASTIPGTGTTDGRARGRGVELPPGATRDGDVELTVSGATQAP